MGKLDDTRDLIRELAELLDSSSLTEIEVEDDAVRIRVARQAQTTVQAVAAAPEPPPAPAPSQDPAAPPPSGEASAAGPITPDSHPGMVPSPMVGTAYLTPEPGAAPFVTEGATVAEGQTLLIIEAMKVMNHIEAPRAGTVTKILIGNGQPVEYGEPLLIIE